MLDSWYHLGSYTHKIWSSTTYLKWNFKSYFGVEVRSRFFSEKAWNWFKESDMKISSMFDFNVLYIHSTYMVFIQLCSQLNKFKLIVSSPCLLS